jgi:hypothetical protein
MTTNAPKRQWLRFSLRTLFVAITILGVFVGYVVHSLRWIRERNEWRHEWDVSPPTVYLHMNEHKRAPWQLVPFGEYGHDTISFRFCPWDEPEPEITDEQKAHYRRAKLLFPEATISTSPLDSLRPQTLRIID